MYDTVSSTCLVLCLSTTSDRLSTRSDNRGEPFNLGSRFDSEPPDWPVCVQLVRHESSHMGVITETKLRRFLYV